MRRSKPSGPVRRSAHSEGGAETGYTFRRSRTITGSAHNDVRAATEQRGQLRSERLQTHDLRKHRRKLFWILLAVVLMISGMWYVLSHYSNEIVRIRVENMPTVAQQELGIYKDATRSYLDQNPFERFTFALNEKRFSEYLRSKAPEIIDAKILPAEALGTSETVLRMRKPVAVWSIASERYYVSDTGIAFKRSLYPDPEVTIVDKSNSEVSGGTVASTKMLRFIGRVVSLVDAGGIGKVTSVELPANSTRQVDILLEGKTYIIKANSDRDPAGQAADIIDAVKYVSTKGISPKYLDVRVQSKAFYQ